MPADTGFVCVPAAPQEGGGELGAACEYTNGCLAGLSCGLAEGFCPEESLRCGLPLCDLTEPDCPDPLECVPVYEPGTEQSELEDVGFCWSE